MLPEMKRVNLNGRWYNVMSELYRVRPDAKIIAWFAGEKKSALFISTVTLAEIRLGIEIRTDPVARTQLTAFLQEIVRPLFDSRVIQAGEDELLAWRLLANKAQKAGRQLPQPDSLIAAVAIVHNMAVATRDVDPFHYAGVPVLNPWTGERFNGA